MGYRDYDLHDHDRVRGIETTPETSLHRGLKARHISMIAIGGAIGTGRTFYSSVAALLALFRHFPAIVIDVSAQLIELKRNCSY
jgi:hypothetical protein